MPAHLLHVGTQLYMAPELLERRTAINACATDIFACGVVLFVIITGSFPFNKKATIDDPVYCHIVNDDISSFWKKWTVKGLPLSRKAAAAGKNMKHE